MRSKLAFDIFNESVVEEMEHSAPEDTSSLREFLSMIRKLIRVLTSGQRFYHQDCASDLRQVLVWVQQWKEECNSSFTSKSEKDKAFLSSQVFQDLSITVNGYLELLHFMSTDKEIKDLQLYFYPRRLNQDFLEGYFGLHRSVDGCSQNMTAQRFGYQSLSIQQTHVLPQNLGSAALELPLRK